MDFLVGTFTHSRIYTLRFTPPSGRPSSSENTKGALEILQCSDASGPHSWLTLSPRKTHLYATAWTEPPSIASYRLDQSSKAGKGATPHLLNTKVVQARSACLGVSATHVYSAGANTGEVFAIADDGSFGELVQTLSFAEMQTASKKQEDVPHGDFGGIRHGAHSAELAPDGRSFYVADIGRNCIWNFAIRGAQAAAGGGGDEEDTAHLRLVQKCVAPRSNDGPRHTTPHPSGKALYSLQEHSSMVDVFSVRDIEGGADRAGTQLEHLEGVRIIPEAKDEKEYWADEVRVGSVLDPATQQPRYLFASTRGLKAGTKGYVAVFELDADGRVRSKQALHIFETATSGGWANAVEPAPLIEAYPGVEYVAMTDSEDGLVFVLGFDGVQVWEVARTKLGGEGGELVGAATAVWL